MTFLNAEKGPLTRRDVRFPNGWTIEREPQSWCIHIVHFLNPNGLRSMTSLPVTTVSPVSSFYDHAKAKAVAQQQHEAETSQNVVGHDIKTKFSQRSRETSFDLLFSRWNATSERVHDRRSTRSTMLVWNFPDTT